VSTDLEFEQLQLIIIGTRLLASTTFVFA